MEEMRIPVVHGNSFKAMHVWFGEMYERGLLFHPDDAPESIVEIETDQPMFSEVESRKLAVLLDAFFSRFGDRVYDAAYPYFMRSVAHSEG